MTCQLTVFWSQIHTLRSLQPYPVLGGLGEAFRIAVQLVAPVGLEGKAVELLFQIPDDRFGAGAHMEPFKNIFHVTVHRPDTDAHGLCDFLVHATFA